MSSTPELALAELAVENNNPTKRDSYLTCLSSGQLHGIECKTGGSLSSRKTPIDLPVGRQRIHYERFNITGLSATPATNISDISNCVGYIEFNVSTSKSSDIHCSIQWPCLAAEPLSQQDYQCTSNEYSWQIIPEENKSVFYGFTLDIQREYQSTAAGVPITVRVNETKFLALGEDLTQDKSDCVTDGRCRIYTDADSIALNVASVVAYAG